MAKRGLIIFFLCFAVSCFGQLALVRDTITVVENDYVLKMPWANGINYSNVSSIDLDLDGKKDVLVFDRVNRFGVGNFRCFLNRGNAGETKYKAAPDMSYKFPPVASWAVCYDYNCDGLEDLFCSTALGIKVYKNISTPGNTPNFTLVSGTLYANYNPNPNGTPLMANLYASSIGVPGIADIDNDGDLDIVDFSSQGVFIDLYKNMSMEKYHNCDSLSFYYTNNCWGKLSESNCLVEFDACGGTSAAAQTQTHAKTYHAGSCLTCLDSDGDHDQDLVLGDVSCNIVQYIHNTGGPGDSAAYFSDTTKLYPNYPNKNSTNQIYLNTFPCTYFLDVNGDAKKDLIATPNVSTGENYKSVWYYHNTSLTNTVNFSFVKKNFLQDEMIEVGQNSFPVLFDYNADGLKDLLIGTYGYFTNDTLRTQLTLYKNTGTAMQPSYSLVTRDYANASQYHLYNAMPTVGDIDGDSDIDICIGTSGGQVHWLENTAGAGQVCNFSVFHNNPFSINTISSAAAPQLFDINGDGTLDLMIGMQNGRIAYYKNTGTTTAPAYSLITNFFGNLDVKNNQNLYGIDGYAAPYFYKEGADTRALVGSVNGNIYYCAVPLDLTAAFYVFNPGVNNYNEGGQSTVCYEDVNGDNKRDLFIGNASGGLSFFSSSGPYVGIQQLSLSEMSNAVSVFPNPAHDFLSVNIDKMEFNSGSLSITDLLGKELLRMPLANSVEAINIASLTDGIYFATVVLHTNAQTFSTTRKIIKTN